MMVADKLTKDTTNVLYAKLRSRFCPNGDLTLGARMLQASAEIHGIHTAEMDDADIATNDISYSETPTASVVMRKRNAVRNFCALFLASVVLICLLTSLIRFLGNETKTESGLDAIYPIATVDKENPVFDNTVFRTEDGLTNAGGGASSIVDTAYSDFREAFSK